MSRHKQWKPSAPELVRLSRGYPESWSYYFPGFGEKGGKRHVPACLWTIKRFRDEYFVQAAGSIVIKQFKTLAEVRDWIALHYERLPAA